MDLGGPMDLSGVWRAAVADDELRRLGPDPTFDDSAWEQVAVPSHWRSSSAFAQTDGPLLYRHAFDHPAAAAPGERRWLVLDGVFYQGDVWLDGTYVGDTEGYFFPHRFEVTEQLAARTEHVLAVEVNCSPPTDRTAKRAVTGVFQHWDCIDPDWNPGGIWRPVRVERTGPVAMRSLRMVCREASATRSVLALRAVLDSAQACAVTLRTRVGGAHEHLHTQSLAAGQNRVTWTVPVPQAERWWPWALGAAVLHRVEVAVMVRPADTAAAAADTPSDVRSLRTGFRSVELRDWVLHVNGERLFVKGANHGPTRMALADASPEDLAADVTLARQAGLDLVRVHAHVTRPELYQAADEQGMLVWQDFPLQWGYARGIRRQAVRQAREAVDLLGHHPCVVLWCGHNEPARLDMAPGEGVTPGTAVRYAAAQQLPTWNRTVLDGAVKRAFEKADPTRPVVAHSGVWPHLPQLEGTDSHLYFGWYHGDERDLPDFARRLPRLVRFVSEFGAQAVPASADFMEPHRWPHLDWEHLGRSHGLQRSVFERHVPPDAFATFGEWREATQAYQAQVVRHHVEHLRRLKYTPTGGFCVFALADCHPAVSWSLLDHRRVPKAAYRALQEACRPVIVVADRLPATVEPGHTLALDVHVVSDLRIPLADVSVTARLSWQGDVHVWRWRGDVPPDACVRVGTLRAVVPPVPGAMELDLELQAGDRHASNHDRTHIRAL